MEYCNILIVRNITKIVILKFLYFIEYIAIVLKNILQKILQFIVAVL